MAGGGRCANWHPTVTDTVAASYLNNTASRAGSAAKAAASRKEANYSEIAVQYIIISFLMLLKRLNKTNQAGCKFLSCLDHRISLVSDEARDTSFLFQRFA